MTMYRPRAAAIPPISALPYPFAGTSTTRAPNAAAMVCDPSVEPLSATITSPEIPCSDRQRCAARMHASSVRASFRQGMTNETSSSVAGACICGEALGVIVVIVKNHRFWPRPPHPATPEC
jgi:hypothetical protein